MKYPIVELELEDVPVTGEVTHLERRTMAVAITDPFQGVSDYSPNIPYFDTRPKSFTVSDGALSEYGESKARCILEIIYRGCQIFEAGSDHFRHVYKSILRKREEPGHLSEEECRSLRRLYRSRLRLGELSKKEYDRRLRKIRKENRRFHDVEGEALDALIAMVVREHRLVLDKDLTRQLVGKYL